MNRDINSYNHGYFIQYRMDIIFFKAYIFKYSLTKKPSFLPNSELLVLLILEFPFNTKSFVCLVKVHIHGKMARTVLQFFQTFLWNLFSHTFALYGFNHIVKITILNQLTLPIDMGGIFALKKAKNRSSRFRNLSHQQQKFHRNPFLDILSLQSGIGGLPIDFWELSNFSAQ